MSIWTFLFGKSRITKIQDEFFGEINDCKGHFEGHKYFNPTKTGIEIYIPNDAIKPFHKTFFQDLEKNYDYLKMSLKVKFEDDIFKNWDENFEIKDFNNEFTLNFILFPEFETGEWEMSYNSIHDKNHVFIGFFKDWQLIDVMMDG